MNNAVMDIKLRSTTKKAGRSTGLFKTIFLKLFEIGVKEISNSDQSRPVLSFS